MVSACLEAFAVTRDEYWRKRGARAASSGSSGATISASRSTIRPPAAAAMRCCRITSIKTRAPNRASPSTSRYAELTRAEGAQIAHRPIMRRLTLHPTGVTFRPDNARVLIRPFIPGDPARIVNIIGRALALSEAEIEEQLAAVTADFGNRHLESAAVWRRHFEQVKAHVFSGRPLSEARQLYIGALFSGEYALESAALFNPSIVAASGPIRTRRRRAAFHPEPARDGRGPHLLDRVSHRGHPRRSRDHHRGAVAFRHRARRSIRTRLIARRSSSTS